MEAELHRNGRIQNDWFTNDGFVFLSILATRIVLVGPPGSKKKEIALGLTAHFSEEGKDQKKDF